jgi:HD-like signal output (HDOD) protein
MLRNGIIPFVDSLFSSASEVSADSILVDEVLFRSMERHAALLPPIPSLVLQIQGGIENPWVDLRHITRLIRTDPNIAGPVLRLANSVYLRGNQEIVELEEALQRIGMDHLRLIVLALSAKPSSGHPALQFIDSRKHRFHSLLVATVAAHLGRAAGCNARALERLWMAGLLHDQGALLLPILESAAWNVMMRHGANSSTPSSLLTLERQHLPWDHAHVGAAFLLRKWSFPAEIAELVRCWPDPLQAGPDQFLADCVRRADLAAQAVGHCWQPPWSRRFTEEDPGQCLDVLEECLPLVRAILPAG